MANPVSGIAHAQQAAQIQAAQSTASKPTQKQNPTNAAAPEDTVTISTQGRAASQVAQTSKPSADVDHDGDSK